MNEKEGLKGKINTKGKSEEVSEREGGRENKIRRKNGKGGRTREMKIEGRSREEGKETKER